jgi:predicted esterase
VHVTEIGLGAKEATLIWIVLHGYAQSTEDLAPVFNEIAKDDLVIIPEGMSKFYRKGYEGEVVASWMTSRHRLDEIRDQQSYMNSVYERIPSVMHHKIIILGFSQGTATALRWLDQNHPAINSMIVYAGWPPEDVDYSKNYWTSINHYYILGNNDYFLTDERVEMLHQMEYWKTCQPKEYNYEGDHSVSKQVIKEIRSKILASS